MLTKSLLLVLLASVIDADYHYYSRGSSDFRSSPQCTIPKLDNGRVFKRQRQRMVKFACFSRYELVGNRYATCKNGQWDVQIPICVRPGCEELPADSNSIRLTEHHDAWVVTFCLPGFKLVGTNAVYCDGQNWNATAPKCVSDVTSLKSLSCDFENSDMCGWHHDELHDFDWIRWNKATPSYFVATGPSHDHTYGEHRTGYYMYIESSGKHENATARLLSPVYDLLLSENTCFSFYYNMYGKQIGGLRVFQKPISVDLLTMLNPVNKDYLLFERWGNQGNNWIRGLSQLKPINEDFQIVIEGLCGDGYSSDIAIDDVALLKGDECAIEIETTTAVIPSQSCVGRCSEEKINPLQCDCTPFCVIYNSCCLDFIDVCIDSPVPGSDDYEATSTETLPETQKLVGETTTLKPTTYLNTTITTYALTTTTSKPVVVAKTTAETPRSLPPRPPVSIKPKTTKKPVTTPKTPITPPKPKTPVTTSKAPVPTSKKPVTTPKIPVTTPKIPVTTPKVLVTTSKAPVTTPKTTTVLAKNTTEGIKTITTLTDSEIDKMKRDEEVKLNEMATTAPQTKNKSSSLKTAVITVVVLALCVSLVLVVIQARSARGRSMIARLRGSTNSNDSEVRYLTSAADEDF